MTIPSGPTPPAGTVEPGQLLADAQTRTLWLGVPPSISSAESLLVGDIVGILEEIADTAADAQAYTDSGLATKANTIHTHAISDVTGLTAALANTTGVPVGCILLWSGTIATIPAGWALCDGTLGTPNLTGRFIMGSGNPSYAQLSSGGVVDRTLATQTGGAHSHGGSTAGATLTTAQIPSHTHTVSDPGHSHGVTDPGHTHNITTRDAFNAASTSRAYTTPAGGGIGGDNTGVQVKTTGVSINNNDSNISINAAGGGGAHSHTITADAGHTHNIATFNVLPPYYVLAYIMKLP